MSQESPPPPATPPQPRPPPRRVVPALSSLYSQIYSLPNIIGRHTINITVTSNPGVVHQWLSILPPPTTRREQVVGIAFEWPFHEIITTTGPSTLTLCIAPRCLIFHLTHAPFIPASLTNFLNSPSTLLYGIWTSPEETQILSTCTRNRVPFVNEVTDPRYIIRSNITGMTLAEATLGEIASEFLGLPFFDFNPEVLYYTNWDALPLNADQITHACLRPLVSCLVGIFLN